MESRGMRSWTLAGVTVLGIAMVLAFSVPVWADGVGSGGVAADPERAAAVEQQVVHPQFFHVGPGRFNYEAAGTGMRNLGSGTIRLRGIPPNSVISRAFLYWAFICVSPAPCPATSVGEFEGVTVTGALFATSGQPCWAGTTIGAYRADVTSLLPRGPGNGYNRDYQLSGFPSGLNTGQRPWAPIVTTLPLSEGATLVAIYTNSALPLTGHVWIHNANTLFSGILDLTFTLVPGSGPFTFAKLTRFGADGQTGNGENQSTTALTGEKTFFGPNLAALIQIAGPGAVLDVDSDWNGGDNRPTNQLWDTRTTDVTGRLPAGGIGGYAVRYQSFGDCMNAIGHVLHTR